MAPTTFPFTVAADPGTDLWRKPPSTDDDNAPVRTLSSGPLTGLKSASITFSARYLTLFDQAGLVLKMTNPAAAAAADAAPRASRWIKAGVEFFGGEPRLSVVCCDRFSDWSIVPLPADAGQRIREGRQDVRIDVERDDDSTLWVYYASGDGAGRLPLREVAWVFGDEGGGEGWELEIGALVARPSKDIEGKLEAQFHAFEVEWKKD